MNRTEKETEFLLMLRQNELSIKKLCAIYASDLESQKDLEQEVVMNIWKSFESFREESKASTWIYRIILNVCLKHTYSLRKDIVSIEGLHGELVNEEDNTASIQQDLSACIQALGFSDKSVIVLYLEDLPYKSISEILGITENHVAVKIKRIRAKLAKCLKEIDSL